MISGVSIALFVVLGMITDIFSVVLFYVFFLKRMRLYCKVNRELKKVLDERDALLLQAKNEAKSEHESTKKNSFL